MSGGVCCCCCGGEEVGGWRLEQRTRYMQIKSCL